MKHPVLLLLIAALSFSCNRPDTRVFIQVKDPNTQLGLDSARVVVYKMWQGTNRQQIAAATTGKEGTCLIAFRSEPDFTYFAEATRPYYQALADSSGTDYQNRRPLTPGTKDTVTLLLSLVTAPDLTALEKLYPRMTGADAVIKLRSGDWTLSALPRLTWEDVPALLAAAEDTGVVTKFPYKPTVKPLFNTRTGLAALWLVEAIRRNTASSRPLDLLQAPSNTPHLRVNGKSDTLNSGTATLAAAKKYQTWWEAVQSLPPRQAAQKNPLAGSGLEWR